MFTKLKNKDIFHEIQKNFDYKIMHFINCVYYLHFVSKNQVALLYITNIFFTTTITIDDFKKEKNGFVERKFFTKKVKNNQYTKVNNLLKDLNMNDV